MSGDREVGNSSLKLESRDVIILMLEVGIFHRRMDWM